MAKLRGSTSDAVFYYKKSLALRLTGNDALKELNEAVYAAGTEALTNTPSDKSKSDDDSSGANPSPSGDSDKPAKKTPNAP